MEELGLYGRKTGVTLKTTLGKNPEEWFESDADEVKENLARAKQNENDLAAMRLNEPAKFNASLVAPTSWNDIPLPAPASFKKPDLPASKILAKTPSEQPPTFETNNRQELVSEMEAADDMANFSVVNDQDLAPDFINSPGGYSAGDEYGTTPGPSSPVFDMTSLTQRFSLARIHEEPQFRRMSNKTSSSSRRRVSFAEQLTGDDSFVDEDIFEMVYDDTASIGVPSLRQSVGGRTSVGSSINFLGIETTKQPGSESRRRFSIVSTASAGDETSVVEDDQDASYLLEHEPSYASDDAILSEEEFDDDDTETSKHRRRSSSVPPLNVKGLQYKVLKDGGLKQVRDESGHVVRRSSRMRQQPLDFWKAAPSPDKSNNANKKPPRPQGNVSVRVFDAKTEREVERALIASTTNLEFRDVKSANYKVAALSVDPYSKRMMSFVMQFPIGSYKPERNSGNFTLSGMLVSGEMELTIHKSKVKLTRGQHFCIPKGNLYKFVNTGKREARVYIVNSSGE